MQRKPVSLGSECANRWATSETKKICLHKRELETLRAEVVATDEHDLYYVDEAGFSLTPSVPYGWQRVGERIELPSSRSQQINVLGFMRYDCSHFAPYVIEGTVDSEVVIACIDNFCSHLTRPTTLVIDNAPPHASARFLSMIEEWEAKNLYLWFLPAYSPELNLIEILWKHIKYRWLPIDAFGSMDKLRGSLDNILKHIGTQYKICFQ